MSPSQRRLSFAQGYLALGMLTEAAAELDGLIGTDFETAEVMAVRVAVLQEQQQWPQLRDLARELAGRTPAEPAAWVTWAYATRRADSLAAAEAILHEAERHHPADGTIQFNLGCYACVRGDLDTARTRVERAIAIDGRFAALATTDPDLAALRDADRTDCQPGA